MYGSVSFAKTLKTFNEELLFSQRNIVVANDTISNVPKQKKELSCD